MTVLAILHSRARREVKHNYTGKSMSVQARIDALKERHAILETRIAEEDQRPRPDSDALLRMKLEKLRLKDEMERLLSQS
jgi:hypothetical protein